MLKIFRVKIGNRWCLIACEHIKQTTELVEEGIQGIRTLLNLDETAVIGDIEEYSYPKSHAHGICVIGTPQTTLEQLLNERTAVVQCFTPLDDH